MLLSISLTETGSVLARRYSDFNVPEFMKSELSGTLEYENAVSRILSNDNFVYIEKSDALDYPPRQLKKCLCL